CSIHWTYLSRGCSNYYKRKYRDREYGRYKIKIYYRCEARESSLAFFDGVNVVCKGKCRFISILNISSNSLIINTYMVAGGDGTEKAFIFHVDHCFDIYWWV